MKRQRYFVSLVCPWCETPMGHVNHASKRVVISGEICAECLSRVRNLAQAQFVVLVVDDAWLSGEVQDRKIPIYAFVRALLITSTPPPPNIPMWEDKFPILPLSLAAAVGFPAKTLQKIGTSNKLLILNDNLPKVEGNSPFMSRVGTC